MSYSPWFLGPFSINHDLAPLIHMIKALSLTLSPEARQRLMWMDRYRECANALQVCRHFGIAPATFWRWKRRYDPWDLSSLEERSRRPHHLRQKTPWEVERQVLALKRAHPRWGKEKLALILRASGTRISGKTCWKICTRHRLIIRYRTRKRRAPKPRVHWAEVRLPGDLWQMDTKYVSLHGRRVYQYTVIDVTSRKRYADLFSSKDMATTIRFLRAAAPVLGTAKMVQTDNGSEFGRAVTTFLRTHGTRHVFSHKRRPQENAYVERSHRIDEEEFYSVGPSGSTLDELRKNFARYLTMYNTLRPHWGLGGRTPEQALHDYQSQLSHMS